MPMSCSCCRFQRVWIEASCAATLSLSLSLLTMVSLSQSSLACERHLHGHQGSQSSAQTPSSTNR